MRCSRSQAGHSYAHAVCLHPLGLFTCRRTDSSGRCMSQCMSIFWTYSVHLRSFRLTVLSLCSLSHSHLTEGETGQRTRYRRPPPRHRRQQYQHEVPQFIPNETLRSLTMSMAWDTSRASTWQASWLHRARPHMRISVSSRRGQNYLCCGHPRASRRREDMGHRSLSVLGDCRAALVSFIIIFNQQLYSVNTITYHSSNILSELCISLIQGAPRLALLC